MKKKNFFLFLFKQQSVSLNTNEWQRDHHRWSGSRLGPTGPGRAESPLPRAETVSLLFGVEKSAHAISLYVVQRNALIRRRRMLQESRDDAS